MTTEYPEPTSRRSSSRNGLLVGLGIGALLSVIFFGGLFAGIAVERNRASTGADISDPNLQNFITAYRLVTEKSYYRPLSSQRLLSAAINGMLQQTGDPHTVYLTAPQSKQTDTQLNGSNFTGIGALVTSTPRGLRIWAPMPGSPALKAGLRVDDLILAVNGLSVKGMTSTEAITRIHGPAGSIVRLLISRNGGRPFVVPVTRGKIAAITAYGRPLPRGLGYVQISSFGDTTSNEVEGALKLLAAQHVRGIVVDLRGDPGGFVDAAQQVVSDFVSHGVVAYESASNKHLTPLPVIEGHQLVKVPVAVLIDGQTASAAEITAAALRDLDHAVLIGARSYGKGSMQSVYNLPDGSTVRITDRLWLTPKKKSVQDVGLKPAIAVTPGAAGTDADLTTAEKYLLSPHVTT